jgi:hypothetical protein
MLLFGSDLALAARAVRALADDLEMIGAGTAPTDADLARAPVISRWNPELNHDRRAAVSGVVSGDPRHPDGRPIWVDIVAADPDLTWIRGPRSWYRLGPAAVEL